MKHARSSSRRPAPLLWVPGRTTVVTEQALLDQSRLRSRGLLVGVLVILAVLATRAAVVMVFPDERLADRLAEQFQTPIELEGRRGALLDRRGRLLAYTVELPSLFVNPTMFPADRVDGSVTAIAAAIGRSESWVRRQITRAGQREVRLADGLDPDVAASLTVGFRRDQLWAVEEPVRLYPGRELAAPLLGFTDQAGDGAAGIEKVLERELAGETYRRLLVRDRKGRSVRAGVDTDRLAQEGRSVRLTIDAAIQHATEEALENAVILSRPEAAMAVVMDVKTGAILAMASLPAGNANDGAARADASLFKNRPGMDQVEPGSVMKPFIAAAALEEGLVTVDTLIDCELGSMVITDRTIRDDHPKGVITVREVIKYSSNIGAAKLGFMLGAERVIQYLSDFGFARPTGLGLPGEVSGQMRAAATIRPIELATTSFGQGMTASSVQLVAAVATLANGGARMQPSLVDAVLDRFGAEESRTEVRIDRRVLSELTASAVGAMMETVTEDGGTGTRARVPGYRVAGKTGTAQKVENGGYSATKRVSSFVGYLPADRPEIAVAVVVDSPTVGSKYGGIVAAPVFSEIGAFSMRYLGIAPTEPFAAADDEPPPPVPAEEGPIVVFADGEGSWVVPDLAGRSVRAVLSALAPSGVKVRVLGSGTLIAQAPAAGARVVPGDEMVLRFD